MRVFPKATGGWKCYFSLWKEILHPVHPVTKDTNRTSLQVVIALSDGDKLSCFYEEFGVSKFSNLDILHNKKRQIVWKYTKNWNKVRRSPKIHNELLILKKNKGKPWLQPKQRERHLKSRIKIKAKYIQTVYIQQRTFTMWNCLPHSHFLRYVQVRS